MNWWSRETEQINWCVQTRKETRLMDPFNNRCVWLASSKECESQWNVVLLQIAAEISKCVRVFENENFWIQIKKCANCWWDDVKDNRLSEFEILPATTTMTKHYATWKRLKGADDGRKRIDKCMRRKVNKFCKKKESGTKIAF